jgi:hypothetical protein
MTSIVFEVLCTFTITSRPILNIRNVSTKVVEKIEHSFYVFFSMPPHVLLGLCGSPPPAVAVV